MCKPSCMDRIRIFKLNCLHFVKGSVMVDKEVLYYIWLLIISFIGGVLNYIKRKAKGSKFSLGAFILGVVSSMFVAYLTFEIGNFYFENEKFAVALAGLAAWMGTDALVGLEEVYKKKIFKEKR